MEQKRLLQWCLCTLVIFWTWQLFVVPALFPPPPKKPVAQEQKKAAADKAVAANDGKPADEAQAGAADKPQDAGAAAEQPKSDAAAPEKPPVELVKHPAQPKIQIGSLEMDSGYRMRVTLNSQGAVVSQIELTDPRYRELDSHEPLKIVGSSLARVDTFQTSIPPLDTALEKIDKTASSSRLDWEVVPGSLSPSAVTFRLATPDGKLEVLKHYELVKVEPQGSRDEAPAYDLHFKFTFLNHSTEPQVVNYELQGPVGLPLEGEEYTRKFRDVVVGFLESDGSVKATTVPAGKVVEAFDKDKLEEWKKPPRYVGVDVQYFAAVLLPRGDQFKDPLVSTSKAVIVGPQQKEKQTTDVSVLLTSVDIDLPADEQAGGVSHEYLLFAGPKRENLLRPIGAEKVIDYGISGRLGIPQAMLALLGFFHSLFPAWAWPYGWSIILLTVLVRSAMYPFSRKQALSAAKMQELQPELAALKKKYNNDTEKFAKAQMELFRKNNYNPFGGCLIMFVQLPIFIGLYQALNISVDLRSAKFLWIDNLAAPDALFRFPFNVPLLGNEFNLLPIITVALFYFQQKMFMPPPTDEQQAMQQKMMSYMMLFMGYMFYSVPAGLCIYFIASSLWGLAERKLLPKSKKNSSESPVEVESAGTSTNGATGGKPANSRATGKLTGGKGKSKQRR